MRGVESFQLHAGIVCNELPVGFCVMFVAMVLPSGGLSEEGLLVWNAPAQTLARQNAEFGFGHIEPASMFRGIMPFEPFDEAARFGCGEGWVERDLVATMHERGILRGAGRKRFRFSCREPLMPFKYHSKGRRHIPRQRHRVTNWREYEVCLGNRGSLTIWFTPDAIAGWKAQPRTTPGGQRHYSNLAIETALTLRAVFRLALRQSEGLIGSIMRMLEIDLPVPDHTTLSRRACGLPVQMRWRNKTSDLHLIVDSTGLKLRGAGEWLFEKHVPNAALGESFTLALTPTAGRSLPLI